VAARPPGADAPVEGLERLLAEARQQGLVQGRQEGESAGYARARQELAPVLERLGRSIEDTAQVKARLRREAEVEIVELSLGVAQRVLRRQVAVDPDALHGLVKAALEKAGKRDVRVLRVHPELAESVRGLLRTLGSLEAVELLPDRTLDPGGVVLETSRGMLDASLDTQLDEISRGFADIIRKTGKVD
jgi:flagellar assembly protein FliH